MASPTSRPSAYKQEREREQAGEMEPGFLHVGCEGTMDIYVEVASQQLDMLDSSPEKRTADLLSVFERRSQGGRGLRLLSTEVGLATRCPHEGQPACHHCLPLPYQLSSFSTH